MTEEKTAGHPAVFFYSGPLDSGLSVAPAFV